MKERCLLVSSFMAEYKGGYISAILKLIEKMHENGDEIVFIFPKAKSEVAWVEDIRQSGCRVYFLDYRPYSLNNIMFIRRVVRQEKINLIYSDFTGWDITVKLAKPFMPTIWHERMRVNDRDTAKRIFNKIKYRIIGAIKTYPVGISDDVYRTVRRLSGRSRATKIYDAAAVERFDLSRERKEHEVKKYLMFSYAPMVKGVDLAFDAFEKLNRKELKAKLVLVSHGTCDVYVRNRYRELPEWLEVRRPIENVEDYYFDCDGFISASRSEGFSQSLMEALYTGMSAIVSDIPGTYWSKHFKGVLFFMSENVDSLYKALLQDADFKISEQDIEFNRNKVTEEYSVDKWVENVIALHKKVLEG